MCIYYNSSNFPFLVLCQFKTTTDLTYIHLSYVILIEFDTYVLLFIDYFQQIFHITIFSVY